MQPLEAGKILSVLGIPESARLHEQEQSEKGSLVEPDRESRPDLELARNSTLATTARASSGASSTFSSGVSSSEERVSEQPDATLLSPEKRCEERGLTAVASRESGPTTSN